MRKNIVMIGTALGAMSGIAAVVNVYVAHGLFQRWRVRYLPTQADTTQLGKAWMALSALSRYLGLLVTGRVALLHVLLASDASFWRKLLFIAPTRLLGVPYVVHVHCGKFVAFYERSRPAAQAAIRFVFRNARLVGALSEEWREALARLFPFAVIETTPNPVEVPAWQAPLEGTPPTVLYLGMLKEAKGVRDLLAAWALVRKAVPGARLVVGGVGEIPVSGDGVEAPGWVRGAEKDALMKRAWVFTLPSHAEALPMSILECMAAGLPVVASRVGGIPLAVEHGRTGLLVEPRDIQSLADALIFLLQTKEQRQAMGAAGRQRAIECFSAEALVPRIEAQWRAIVPQQEIHALRVASTLSGVKGTERIRIPTAS